MKKKLKNKVSPIYSVDFGLNLFYNEKGRLHREDGPAIVLALDRGYTSYVIVSDSETDATVTVSKSDLFNGSAAYWIDGQKITKIAYYKRLYKNKIITKHQMLLNLL